MINKNINIFYKIYNSDIYTISIVILALFSIFFPLTNTQDLCIDAIFIADLILSTFLFVKYAKKKSIKAYFKLHTFDIISCIPLQFLNIGKLFRFVRLVRTTRLLRLNRTSSFSIKPTLTNLFKFDTFKELFIYFAIYLIGNAYIFEEIKHTSFLNVIYWVMTTITTVGYGDVSPTHPTTKILSMFLMIIGVATMGYINGAIISVVVTQNKK